ncbi:MAG: hypothetical protein AB1734_05665 [Elusimicrobiota bacterium]
MIKKYGAKGALVFLWHWILSGFLLGTLTLMGPVRWTADAMRAAGRSDSAEKAVVLVFIAVLAAVSILLARRLTAATLSASGIAGRLGLPALSLAMFLAAMAFWMNPKMMAGAGAKGMGGTFAGSEFVFGPYPEKERLAELKAEGYTAVVPLMSRAVAPFEPVLLEKEIKAAREIGLELIHVPMLPWISSNDHVDAEIRKLLDRGGKYYVHCYLGRDRVRLFQRMLANASGGTAAVSGLSRGKNMSERKKFERGPVTDLGGEVFLTPYPTDEEFMDLVNSGVASLVSLLDPKNPEDLPWIKKEKELAGKYKLAYANYPWKSMTPAQKEKAVRETMKMDKPAVVHAFLAPSGSSDEFAGLYKKLRKP